MRLVQVAKILGMTGQQLRKELSEVDFGVKPTDREVPGNLAQGIIRFVSRKRGLNIDMDALGFGIATAVLDEEETTTATEEKVEIEVEEKKEEKKEGKSTLHVLRKLTLDDVSQEDIQREKQALSGEGEKKSFSVTTKSLEKKKSLVQEQIKRKEGVVVLPDQISVKEFAEKSGVQVPKVVGALLKNGVMVTVNQTIDYDTAAIVAADLNVEVKREQGAASAQALLQRDIEGLLKDDPENLQPRPPIVVVMGHVDHGKTAILDAIRKTDVVAGEAGGITQHIGAYQVHHNDRSITFLDTPGHEAFTAMRAHGARVTDIAILVVAADEGVKETTIEAIHHAQEANLSILVAINKIDKEGADPERVKGELAKYDLQSEDWGGKIPFVLCSAVTKQGIDSILEHVLLLADMAELKANPNRYAVATVIESHLDSSLGPLGTIIVNTGTLRCGDVFVCGETMGKIRTMTDAHGERQKEAPPSCAVRVSGLQDVPKVGDILQVVSLERDARDLLKEYQEQAHMQKKPSLADLMSRISEGKLTQVKIVLKADTQGSLDALEHSLEKCGTDEVAAKVIHGGIGAVSETDVMMAAASEGLILAFHVSVPPRVRRVADQEGVEVREYDVIYALLEEVEKLLEGLLEPEETENILGHLEVRGTFFKKKNEQIIGGKVLDGAFKRGQFRLQREGEEVGIGKITSLKRGEKDVKEVKEGMECGMKVEIGEMIQEGDVLEVFVKVS